MQTLIASWNEDPASSNEKFAELLPACHEDKSLGRGLITCLSKCLPNVAQIENLLKRNHIFRLDNLTDDFEALGQLIIELLPYEFPIDQYIGEWETLFATDEAKRAFIQAVLEHPQHLHLLGKIQHSEAQWSELLPTKEAQFTFLSEKWEQIPLFDIITCCTHLDLDQRFELASLLIDTPLQETLIQHLANFRLDQERQVALLEHSPNFTTSLIVHFDELTDEQRGEWVLAKVRNTDLDKAIYEDFAEIEGHIPDAHCAEFKQLYDAYFAIEEAFAGGDRSAGLELTQELTRHEQIPVRLRSSIENHYVTALTDTPLADLVKEINTYPSGLTHALVNHLCSIEPPSERVVGGNDRTKINGTFFFTQSCVEMLTPPSTDEVWTAVEIPDDLMEAVDTFKDETQQKGVILLHWDDIPAAHYTPIYLEKVEGGITVFIADSLGEEGNEPPSFTHRLIDRFQEDDTFVNIYALQPARQVDYSSCLHFSMNDATYFMAAEDLIAALLATDTVVFKASDTDNDGRGIYWVGRPPLDMRKITQSTTLFDAHMSEGGDGLIATCPETIPGVTAEETSLSELQEGFWFYSPSHYKPYNALPDLCKTAMLARVLELPPSESSYDSSSSSGSYSSVLTVNNN